MSEGPERAKRFCIDHPNAKKQTALMVACKHGWVRPPQFHRTNAPQRFFCLLTSWGGYLAFHLCHAWERCSGGEGGVSYTGSYSVKPHGGLMMVPLDMVCCAGTLSAWST